MSGFLYMASPYSKYPGGLEAAFRLAAEQTAILIRAKVPVFSPITHSHPIAVHGNIDPLDHEIWLPADRPMMDAATGLIAVRAESWEQSYGMKVEIDHFLGSGKPVFYMNPGEPPPGLLAYARAMRNAGSSWLYRRG